MFRRKVDKIILNNRNVYTIYNRKLHISVSILKSSKLDNFLV